MPDEMSLESWPGLLQVFAAPVDAGGQAGEAALWADLGDRYEAGSANISAIACDPNTGRVLLTVRNRNGPTSDQAWYSELWLLDAEGRPVIDHGLLRDTGASQVAWSPDGRTALVAEDPFVAAGRTVWLDLASGEAQPVGDHVAFTDIGASVADLLWTGNGRSAAIESHVWLDGPTADMQTVDLSGAKPVLGAQRELPGAIGFVARGPEELAYLAQTGDDSGGRRELAIRSWRPGTADADPTELGRFPSPVTGDFYLVNLLALPGAGDDRFVLLLWGADHIGGLFLVDLARPDQPAVWRLTAPDVDVDDVQLGKDGLLYLTAPPARHEARDPIAQLHALPLARLDRGKVATDPAFSRVGGR